jgi:hypothetical protein
VELGGARAHVLVDEARRAADDGVAQLGVVQELRQQLVGRRPGEGVRGRLNRGGIRRRRDERAALEDAREQLDAPARYDPPLRVRLVAPHGVLLQRRRREENDRAEERAELLLRLRRAAPDLLEERNHLPVDALRLEPRERGAARGVLHKLLVVDAAVAVHIEDSDELREVLGREHESEAVKAVPELVRRHCDIGMVQRRIE